MGFLHYFKSFDRAKVSKTNQVVPVNNHLHTPFSFSAFGSVEEALDQAVEEGVQVVGVNDFNSFDAYNAWCNGAFARHLFPLFNVEFIGLNKNEQQQGRKVNDPGNPGRTYLSGKALAHPLVLSPQTLERINGLKTEANNYVKLMTEKVNNWLATAGYPFQIDYVRMEQDLSYGQVRERHLARAIRLLAEQHFTVASELEAFYHFALNGIAVDKTNEAQVENELRNALLKAGKPAYVEEDTNGFLDVETLCTIILEAGGVPTYPFLGDAVKGFTDFERNPDEAVKKLRELGIWSVEFIPTRNDHEALKTYVTYLRDQGFVVSFGTEHNAPGRQPVKVYAKGGVALDETLQAINYEGACILAAHQYLFAKEGEGILDGSGRFKAEQRKDFVELGDDLISFVINRKN